MTSSLKSPFPQASLFEECTRAAKIIEEFRRPSDELSSLSSSKGKKGKHIPEWVLDRAAGIAVLSIVKGGFLVSAQGGSGIVVRKLSDTQWSAPAAIGILGMGGGFLIGLAQMDFVLVLNSKRAMDSFMNEGSLKLGGDLSIAVGPLGRDAEAMLGVSTKIPAMYSYGRSKGLFASMALDATGFMSRPKDNAKFYGVPVTAKEILSGSITVPETKTYVLYRALKTASQDYKRASGHRAAPPPPSAATTSYGAPIAYPAGPYAANPYGAPPPDSSEYYAPPPPGTSYYPPADGSTQAYYPPPTQQPPQGDYYQPAPAPVQPYYPPPGGDPNYYSPPGGDPNYYPPSGGVPNYYPPPESSVDPGYYQTLPPSSTSPVDPAFDQSASSGSLSSSGGRSHRPAPPPPR